MANHRYDLTRLQSDIAAIEDLPVFIAYNTNVDAVVRVDGTLEAYLDPPPEPGKHPPPSLLGSKRDLATAITYTMAMGRGDEVAMTDDLAATLESELDPDTQQMGGQAGIMTNLLTSLGAAPITYTYMVSERQLSMFKSPGSVQYPVVEDGTITYISLDKAINTERTKINWVFEFRAGDELFGVRATDDTRFIAASRPPEFNLIAPGIDTNVDQIGTVVDGALLAGYHNLTPDIVENSYIERLNHARDVIRRLRSGDDLPVHIEYAVTQDDELRESIYEWVLPEATVIGVDAHELSMLHHDTRLEVVSDEPTETTPFETEEILAHYQMLSAIRAELGVKCIRLHAMEYHLAVMDSYLPQNSVRRGLEFSAINAATKAHYGDITSPDDLETGLEYERSKMGIEAIQLLADHLNESADDGILMTPSVVACPNRVVREHAGTVGIGDIVSSSSFILEIAIANGHG